MKLFIAVMAFIAIGSYVSWHQTEAAEFENCKLSAQMATDDAIGTGVTAEQARQLGAQEYSATKECYTNR